MRPRLTQTIRKLKQVNVASIMLALIVVAPVLSHASDEQVCDALLRLEKEINVSLPAKVDDVITATKIEVNCAFKQLTYAKVVSEPASFFDDARKAAINTRNQQVHCAANGLTRKYGYAVLDVYRSSSGEVALASRVVPADCQ